MCANGPNWSRYIDRICGGDHVPPHSLGDGHRPHVLHHCDGDASADRLARFQNDDSENKGREMRNDLVGYECGGNEYRNRPDLDR